MALAMMPAGPTAGMSGMSEGHQKWGNRIFGNMTEHGIMFFPALWCYAIFVDADEATLLGAAYLIFRGLYPVIWATVGGESGAPFPVIFISTFPQYGIIVYECLGVLLKLSGGVDVDDYFFNSDIVGVLICTAGFLAYALGLWPKLHGLLFARCFGKGSGDKGAAAGDAEKQAILSGAAQGGGRFDARMGCKVAVVLNAFYILLVTGCLEWLPVLGGDPFVKFGIAENWSMAYLMGTAMAGTVLIVGFVGFAGDNAACALVCRAIAFAMALYGLVWTALVLNGSANFSEALVLSFVMCPVYAYLGFVKKDAAGMY